MDSFQNTCSTDNWHSKPTCAHNIAYAMGECVLCGQKFPFCPKCENGIFCKDCQPIRDHAREMRQTIRKDREDESARYWAGKEAKAQAEYERKLRENGSDSNSA